MIEPRSCPDCRAAMVIGIASNARGETIHPWYCGECDKAWGSLCASKADLPEWCREHGSLPRVFTGTEKAIQSGRINLDQMFHMTPCEVCGERGSTENHHWAPFHLFGDEANKWPVSPLCSACHKKWHRLVTPNMGSKRRAA